MTTFIIRHEQKSGCVIDEINANVPEIQRAADQEHITEIYEFQRSYHAAHEGKYCMNGTISIAVDTDDDSEYLVDGQHRVIAYKLLRQDDPASIIEFTVDYYYVAGMDAVDQVYKLVNTCKINNVSKLHIDKYKILNEFSKYLSAQFGSYLKSSARPNRPNINVDAMIDRMNDIDLIDRMHIVSGEQLIQYFNEINSFYSRESTATNFSKWGIKNHKSIIAKIKRRPSHLYIGLYRNFEPLNRMIDWYEMGCPDYSAIQHYALGHRPKITKKLRKLVWNCGELEQECYCCGDIITYDSFECGHIVAVARGGKTVVDNLKAICGDCNREMMTENLEEFKDRLAVQLY